MKEIERTTEGTRKIVTRHLLGLDPSLATGGLLHRFLFGSLIHGGRAATSLHLFSIWRCLPRSRKRSLSWTRSSIWCPPELIRSPLQAIVEVPSFSRHSFEEEGGLEMRVTVFWQLRAHTQTISGGKPQEGM